MSKHTSGPWDVDPNDKFAVTADCDGLQVCGTEYEDRADDENAANARLIAAAPELLDVCKVARGALIDRFNPDWSPYIRESVEKVLGRLEAVIEKAEGVAQ
jgi:glycine/D-amino acid oxidase-like deaminating enzyme